MTKKLGDRMLEPQSEPRRCVICTDNVGAILGVNFNAKFSVKSKQLSRMVAVIARLAQGVSLGMDDVACNFGVTKITVCQDMKRLRDWGLAEFSGRAKTGNYRLTEEGRLLIEGMIQ